MSYQVLSRQTHQNLRLRTPAQHWSFARDRGFVGLVAAELGEAARTMPVVFRVQDDQAALVGLMGFGPNNLFVDANGRWQVPYIPGVLRAWPFALVPKDDQQVVVIERDSDFFDTEEGELLFDAQGEPGERLQKIVEFLRVMGQQEALTQRAVAAIRGLNLLVPWEPVVKRADGQSLRLQGLFMVDQKAFDELSDEDFLTLRREGGLPVVYAHSLSLRSIAVLEQLARRQAQTAAPTTVALPDGPEFTDEYLKF
ncbi:MAG: SapC family protein [Pigmentiphaga sp.]|nr:SapC family protein [Pigmentiphaga sp.]